MGATHLDALALALTLTLTLATHLDAGYESRCDFQRRKLCQLQDRANSRPPTDHSNKAHSSRAAREPECGLGEMRISRNVD